MQCEPLPPSPDPTFYPAGKIRVRDTQRETQPGGGFLHPVRNLKLVAYRWFRIQNTSTDDLGNFTITKNFRRKVKLKAKFTNQYCTVRGIRGARLWEMLLPIAPLIGKYTSDDIHNVDHFFDQNIDTRSRGMRNWTAATSFNAVQEHREYANQLNFNAAPMGLNVYVTNATRDGTAPLFQKRWVQTLPIPFVNKTLVSDNMVIAGGLTALTTTLGKANVDISIGYNRSGLTSDALKATVYHEMSHASHYSKAGSAWYTDFVNAELNEMTLHVSDGLSPYGDGNDSYGPIIALGEGWANFMGRFLADRRYGANSSSAIEQNIEYNNNSPVAGLSSHLNLLEDFNPSRTVDPFRWIPQGLMYDLMDTRNDIANSNRVLLNDDVVGYTIQQFCNALQSDINSMPLFRTRLLSQNNNNQAAGVTTIFTFYGY